MIYAAASGPHLRRRCTFASELKKSSVVIGSNCLCAIGSRNAHFLTWLSSHHHHRRLSSVGVCGIVICVLFVMNERQHSRRCTTTWYQLWTRMRSNAQATLFIINCLSFISLYISTSLNACWFGECLLFKWMRHETMNASWYNGCVMEQWMLLDMIIAAVYSQLNLQQTFIGDRVRHWNQLMLSLCLQ